MSDPVITFYDIASNKGTMSPFTWRARLALNVKKVPHRTQFLPFEEIEPFMKSIGAKPTTKKPAPDDAEGWYTCPVLVVPGKSPIEGSDDILQYLDTTYPDAPTFFPRHSHALQSAFSEYFMVRVIVPTAELLQVGVISIIDGASLDYYCDTRRRWKGIDLKTVAHPGTEERARIWRSVKEAWDGFYVSVYSKRLDKSSPWIMGTEPTAADLVVLGLLGSMRATLLDTEWKEALEWHEGAWGRLWEASVPFQG